MNYNDASFLRNVIGMPTRHMNAFTQVANIERAVILVRATGPTCHGLLEEGYDTKGYRIHGKSCTWGPMAGFVLRDPRLNKAGMGKAVYNRKQHQESLVDDHEGQGWKASITPLKISEVRRNWLMERKVITATPKGLDRYDGRCQHPTGISFHYSLIREDELWGVYFDNTRQGEKWIQERGDATVKYHPKYGPSYEPMLAMTNPPEHRKFPAENYRNAVTGDYDLFAVWPFVKEYNAGVGGDDHRPLGTVRGSLKGEGDNIAELERNFTESGQGTKLGNITFRIYNICQLINSIVSPDHVLWHSDEAARPFVDDVDLPVVAFTPSGDYAGIENISDFKWFIRECLMDGIKVTLSNGWTQDPTPKFLNRLGTGFAQHVPPDGRRTIVPHWYNS